MDTANHQESYGWLCSVENPGGSGLMKLPEWIENFGTPDEPVGAWRVHQSDGCQHGMYYPGDDDPGTPMRKTQDWLANWDLSAIELRCEDPRSRTYP